MYILNATLIGGDKEAEKCESIEKECACVLETMKSRVKENACQSKTNVKYLSGRRSPN